MSGTERVTTALGLAALVALLAAFPAAPESPGTRFRSIEEGLREARSNAPEVQALMDRYGVRGFPTLVVGHADRMAAVREVGFASRDRSLTFLREAGRQLKKAEEKEDKARKP